MIRLLLPLIMVFLIIFGMISLVNLKKESKNMISRMEKISK
ncbi:hypothetical protein GYY_03885 [Methanococcus maripaludis X1]|uniref:Uncharacterized protein n=1 Tax=Methanococcus maripaludis X1 TaxID=1053692 RepID=G0H4M3_METMI|nr:hypothetical protein GYY_03885 [Methanococcus maripaludis X1]